MAGYIGKLLQVDLTSGAIGVQPLDPAFARPYIGASGLAARLYFDMTLARGLQAEPFSPHNPLLIMTGPLQGTTLPGSGRFSVCSRSPLTTFWGESNCGGDMGPFLKFAGFDGIVITGAAAVPSVLWIEDGHAELCPAAGLWGKDTYETADALGAAGGKGAKVFCIGPAGENLVRYAAILSDKKAAAGRTGMGAVMGSKKLKAIVVRGSGKVTIANPEPFKALRRAVQAKIHDNLPLQGFKSFGTAGSIYYNSLVGDIAARNWQQGTFDDSALLALDGTTLADTILTGSSACYACPVVCKREVEVTDGGVTRAKGAGPEYETIMGFGPMLMNSDLKATAAANELCNRLGLDTISCSATIAFATEATERGLLPSDLKWAETEPMLAMIGKIAQRTGPGDLLAEGVKRAAVRLGVAADADWVPHVKGSELPMHDPRCYYGVGLGYATSPRGANHNAANVYIELGSAIYPEMGLDGDLSSRRTEGKAFLSAMSQRLGCVVDALTLCFFDSWGYTLEEMCQALNCVAGFDYDVAELARSGERLWALKRSISNLLGATAADDRLPGRLLTPLADGPTAGSAPDLPAMLREFYEICDIDEKGRVSRERLESLGLGDVAALL
jgi:aldehyde:ferredoxin oxidoreductase